MVAGVGEKRSRWEVLTLMQDRSTDSEPSLRWFRRPVGEVGRGIA